MLGEVTPNRLADMRVELSAIYSSMDWDLIRILSEKPAKWNELRKSFKSDTACDRAWEATADGMEEVKLRRTLKSIEKMMSAAKTKLEVLNGEARNQY